MVAQLPSSEFNSLVIIAPTKEIIRKIYFVKIMKVRIVYEREKKKLVERENLLQLAIISFIVHRRIRLMILCTEA